MGISHIHVVHKAKLPQKRDVEDVVGLARRDDSDSTACTTGFYLSPAMGATVDSLQPLPISWNSTCTSTKDIDIYLYSPGSEYPRIHVWEGIALSRGTYDAAIMPRWWNATASQSLQIIIVAAGQPPFLSTFPGGPVFTATYAPPAGGSTPAAADTSIVDSGITQVNDAQNAKKAMTPGKKAAAALLPLLFVIGLCVAAYLKMKRSRNKDKRKQWAEAVDKRMSTISTDWKSVSAAGANAAIRNSMAVGLGNRASSAFGFGAIRPASTYAVEGGDGSDDNHNVGPTRPMSQLRTGVGLRNPAALSRASTGERVSRVSFAPDTRVSRVSFADGTRPSRAFHSAYIPPVPALPGRASHEQEEEGGEVDVTDEKGVEGEHEHEHEVESDGGNTNGSFSPRQTQGALTLTPEDIRSRIAAGKARAAAAAAAEKERQSSEKERERDTGFAELMPALSLMRTGNDADDLLFPAPPMPASPPPTYPKSPMSPTMSMNTAYSTAATAAYSPTPSYSTTAAAYPTAINTTASAYSTGTNPSSTPMSPVMSAMPMQPMPASVMSPDEMLRAYAERKKSMHMSMSAGAGRISTAAISHPMPVASTALPIGGGSGMRVLYNTNTGSNTGAGYAQEEDPYGGMSIAPGPPPTSVGNGAYAFGHHQNGSIGVGMYGGARYAIGEDEHEHGDEHGEGQGGEYDVGRAA